MSTLEESALSPEVEPQKKNVAVKVGVVGCLAAIGILVCIVGFAGGLFFVINQAMISSEPYQTAMDSARANGQVTAALGDDFDSGFFIFGTIETSGMSGNADMSIPVSGSVGKGTIYVEAWKQNGVWEYYTLAVYLDDTGETITLEP